MTLPLPDTARAGEDPLQRRRDLGATFGDSAASDVRVRLFGMTHGVAGRSPVVARSFQRRSRNGTDLCENLRQGTLSTGKHRGVMRTSHARSLGPESAQRSFAKIADVKRKWRSPARAVSAAWQRS